jgi:hypothetical protein
MIDKQTKKALIDKISSMKIETFQLTAETEEVNPPINNEGWKEWRPTGKIFIDITGWHGD